MAIHIFGEHIEDLVENYPGSRASAAWCAFLAPGRRSELAKAAFEAVAAAQCGLFPRAVCAAPDGWAEARYWAAQLRSEAAVAGIAVADLQQPNWPLMEWF